MKYCNYDEFLSYVEELYKIELKLVNNIFCNLIICEEQEKYNYKKVENQLHNVHDISLRNILMNKREMAIFLNNILSLKGTKNQINENNLELCNQNFITKSFFNKQADIIYKRKDMNVYFLVEHQSKVDYEMPKRILEYMIEILRENINSFQTKNKRYKFPLIIPIVLYTGSKKWTANTYIGDSIEEMPGYKTKEFGKYILVDTNSYSENELIDAEGVLTKIILLDRAKGKKEVEDKYEKINKRTYLEEEKELLDEYTCNVASKVLTKDKIEKIREKYKKEGEKESMLVDVLMQLKEEYKIEGLREGKIQGKREGKKEGKKEQLELIVKKMLKNNMDIELIKKITNLNEIEINKIKNGK